MRICLFGNSHAAALISAWNSKERNLKAKLKIDLMVRPKDGPRGLIFRDGKLWSDDAEMQRFMKRFGAPQELNLADYDAFVITGAMVSMLGAASVVQETPPSHWPSSLKYAQALQDGVAVAQRQLISQHTAETALDAQMEASLGAGIAKSLLAQSDAPVFLSPQPRPCERILQMSRKRTRLRKLIKRGDAQMASELYDEMYDRFAAQSPRLEVLHQPPRTIHKSLTTKRDYTKAARRLTSPKQEQPEDDTLHANAEYGALVLRRVLKQMGAT